MANPQVQNGIDIRVIRPAEALRFGVATSRASFLQALNSLRTGPKHSPLTPRKPQDTDLLNRVARLRNNRATGTLTEIALELRAGIKNTLFEILLDKE